VNRETLAQEMRLRYRYRSLILRGELRLPPEAAVALVGPDCAYHLYRRAWFGRDPEPGPRPSGRP